MTTGQLQRRQTEISQFSTEHAMGYMLGFNLRVVKMWLDASARHLRRMSHSKCHVNVSRHNMSEKIHSLYHSIMNIIIIYLLETTNKNIRTKQAGKVRYMFFVLMSDDIRVLLNINKSTKKFQVNNIALLACILLLEVLM